MRRIISVSKEGTVTKEVLDYIRQHRYIWWSLFLPCYLAVFFTIEHFITTDYWATQTVLDSYIPFCEFFAPIYVSWSPMLVAVGLYLLIKDPENFRRFVWMLMLAFGTATLICILIPNGQDLRPVIMPRDNLCSWIVAYTYSIDTNTNVFPSVHVLGVFSIWCAVRRTPELQKRAWTIGIAVWGILVIASTLFIKQHACIDVLAAVPVAALAYGIVYGIIGKKRDRMHIYKCKEGKTYGELDNLPPV